MAGFYKLKNICVHLCSFMDKNSFFNLSQTQI